MHLLLYKGNSLVENVVLGEEEEEEDEEEEEEDEEVEDGEMSEVIPSNDETINASSSVDNEMPTEEGEELEMETSASRSHRYTLSRSSCGSFGRFFKLFICVTVM
jgi:hypothetical protein